MHHTNAERTDQAKCRMNICMTSVELDAVPADFARTLETELNAALAKNDGLRVALDELTHAVGWGLLNALTSKEIKDSYSDIAKAYNKAQRTLNSTP